MSKQKNQVLKTVPKKITVPVYLKTETVDLRTENEVSPNAPNVKRVSEKRNFIVKNYKEVKKPLPLKNGDGRIIGWEPFTKKFSNKEALSFVEEIAKRVAVETRRISQSIFEETFVSAMRQDKLDDSLSQARRKKEEVTRSIYSSREVNSVLTKNLCDFKKAFSALIVKTSKDIRKSKVLRKCSKEIPEEIMGMILKATVDKISDLFKLTTLEKNILRAQRKLNEFKIERKISIDNATFNLPRLHYGDLLTDRSEFCPRDNKCPVTRFNPVGDSIEIKPEPEEMAVADRILRNLLLKKQSEVDRKALRQRPKVIDRVSRKPPCFSVWGLRSSQKTA